ncbi:MAG: hypothetical protein AAGH40_12935, partial [Verrucomicrobiota bacterium]
MDLVPDWDRNGVIDQADREKVTDTDPFRWWFNDDDDEDAVSGDDRAGASSPDFDNTVIDSERDLVDFFPLFLDLKSCLEAFNDLSTIEVKLTHENDALKFVYTDLLPEDSGDYLRESNLTTGFGSNFDQAPGEADTVAIGTALSEVFLTKIRDEDKGVLLLEGASNSSSILDKPLKLEVSRSGSQLFEFEMPLRLGPVTDMYRVEDFSPVADSNLSSITASGEPALYPDSLTNDRTFMHVHGFKISQDQSLAWHNEIFKRLHQLGSNAKFVGVTWHGDTAPDYHKAVYQAFKTSENLNQRLGSYSNITIAAHSLGNVVISNAMEKHQFDPL